MSERTLKDVVGEGPWSPPPGARLCAALRRFVDAYAPLHAVGSSSAIVVACPDCRTEVTVYAQDGLRAVKTADALWTRQGGGVDGVGIWITVRFGSLAPPPARPSQPSRARRRSVGR